MQGYSGKTAVITGAASGIGLALAARAAKLGMKLVLADIDADRLAEAALGLGLDPGRCCVLRTDVSRDEDVAALARLAFERYGAVHLLCNNAGVALSRVTWEHSLADWQWVLGVNLWSVIHGIRHFLPPMLAQAEGGHVVNTASAAGLVSTPGMAAYNVSKHGVVTLSETLYGELRALNAKVDLSLLCPAWVATGIQASERNRQPQYGQAGEAGEASRAYHERLGTAVKSGRLSADDMAAAVFDAVAAKRFYVIPHRKINNAIKMRLEDILEARNPSQLA